MNGKPWTEDEDRIVFAALADGLTYRNISERLIGRSISAVGRHVENVVPEALRIRWRREAKARKRQAVTAALNARTFDQQQSP